MISASTTVVIIDGICNIRTFHLILLFVIPLFYLVLRQRHSPPPPPSPSMMTLLATTNFTTNVPLDTRNKNDDSTVEISSSALPTMNDDTIGDSSGCIVRKTRTLDATVSPAKIEAARRQDRLVNSSSNDSVTTDTKLTTATASDTTRATVDTDSIDKWKCNCFAGQQFLPKSIFGNMEAVLKMGTGECYHSQ